METIDRTRDALLIVDLQHDFLPGGALPVEDSDAIVAPIAQLAERFATVVATQDFHPPGHVSFASRWDKRPLEVVEVNGEQQRLWPDHCVAGTRGAALACGLPDGALTLILRKGTRREVDSYSAFREGVGPDGARASTGLAELLRERGVERLFCCGLALDYCVQASARDAAQAGFRVLVLDDLCRAIDPGNRLPALEAAGVRRASSTVLA
jgi:nicotinamidase/pyrazinamidase